MGCTTACTYVEYHDRRLSPPLAAFRNSVPPVMAAWSLEMTSVVLGTAAFLGGKRHVRGPAILAGSQRRAVQQGVLHHCSADWC
jgi:hypothetical protein